MARADYGRVGSKRGGSAVWQWVVIGITLGLGCSAILLLSLLTLGVLNLDESLGIALEPTATATTAPTDAPPEPTADIDATIVAAIALTMDAQPTTTPVQVAAPTATDIPPVVEASDDDDDQPAAPATTEDDEDDPLQDVPSGLDDADELLDELDSDDVDVDLAAPAADIPPELLDIATDLIVIDGGTFQMGTTPQEVGVAVRECIDRDGGLCQAEFGQDSYPEHAVTLDTYQIEELPVTNRQYVNFLNWMGPNSHLNGCFNQRCVDTTATQEFSQLVFDSQNYDTGTPIFDTFPVVGVTWFGARAYCEALGRRLPTEAEWERAARGPQGNLYPWGNEWEPTLARNSRSEENVIGAIEVGAIPGNITSEGVRDMAGNVAEWVADWYSRTYYSQPEASGLNPTGPVSGSDKVVRGGSWDAVPFFTRTVNRQNRNPSDTYLWLGFRCAADFDEDSALPSGDFELDEFEIDPDEGEFEGETGANDPVDAAPQLPPTPAPAVPPGSDG